MGNGRSYSIVKYAQVISHVTYRGRASRTIIDHTDFMWRASGEQAARPVTQGWQAIA